MKYSAFEQAALEASAGLKEIDAEIARLQEKREMLDLLLTSARRLLADEPLKTETFPANEANLASVIPYEPRLEQASSASNLPESSSSSFGKDQWSAFMRDTASGSPRGK